MFKQIGGRKKRISKKEEENIFPAGFNLGFFGRGEESRIPTLFLEISQIWLRVIQIWDTIHNDDIW